MIGLVGEKGCGDTHLLRLAAGLEKPLAGEIAAPVSSRYIGVADTLNLAPVDLLILDHALACADALVRARAGVALERLRASGTTILIASHELDLLGALCDEIWWLEGGKIAGQGDPREVLDAYRAHISQKFLAWGDKLTTPLSPSQRRGDGRAEIQSLETIGPDGRASAVLASGAEVTVRLVVRFHEAVENPVVGIMIRTRIGLEVYGTNTDLEGVRIGPCAGGETKRVEFRFRCDLCPKEYTLTAASHDPGGAAHDWVDDAVSFQVTDSRYTAGVANLRATVSATRLEAAG